MNEFFKTEEADGAFDRIRFSDGAQKRTTLVFLLDTSSSMNGDETAPPPRPIDELNDAVKAWADHLHSSHELRYRAELAVITFGEGGVRVYEGSEGSPFVPAAVFTPPTLTAGGVTPMFEAIRSAIDLSERRKGELDDLGIQRFRPLIFMLTDGAPTDNSGHLLPQEDWQTMAAQIAALEAKRKLAFFAVGVSGADRECLATLAPASNWQVSHDDLARFLIEASNSAADEEDPIKKARDLMQSMARNAQK
jgi:uncharacterized protein YegL